jgi:hypothetical protein
MILRQISELENHERKLLLNQLTDKKNTDRKFIDTINLPARINIIYKCEICPNQSGTFNLFVFKNDIVNVSQFIPCPKNHTAILIDIGQNDDNSMVFNLDNFMDDD